MNDAIPPTPKTCLGLALMVGTFFGITICPLLICPLGWGVWRVLFDIPLLKPSVEIIGRFVFDSSSTTLMISLIVIGVLWYQAYRYVRS